MKKILILAGYYTPSVKGGGPIQSIQNLVNNLSEYYDFYILANDRDIGDARPFEDIEPDNWNTIDCEKVYYTDYRHLNIRKLKKIINSQEFDIVYLNSFFDVKLSIYPMILKKLKIIANDKIVVAPRGNFSPGALNSKKGKKFLYIKVAKILNLYKDVIWHATASTEKKDVETIFGENLQIEIANNLTANYNNLIFTKDLKKCRGKLKVVFVSRIHPKKNLKHAINLLHEVNGEVRFNIYGPIEDRRYWEECKREILLLPSNIKVEYCGIVNHDEIINVFKEHHIFLFPTLGENFGHVISEALIGGCPVIVSDQTPWRDLESEGVGWDINLMNTPIYTRTIQKCIDMNDIEYKKYSTNAFNYGKKKSNINDNISAYYHIF